MLISGKQLHKDIGSQLQTLIVLQLEAGLE